MARYEIPLTPLAQEFRIQIVETVYTVRVYYLAVSEGGWCLDISTDEGVPLICGIPLICGADLLAQHRHVGLGVTLELASPDELPASYTNLGTTTHLVFEALA